MHRFPTAQMLWGPVSPGLWDFGTFGIVYHAEGYMLKDPVTVKEFFRGILLIASTLSREKTVSPLRHEVGGGGSTGNRPQARTAFFRTAGATVWPVWKVGGYLRPCRDPVLRAYRPQAKTMQSRYTDGFLRGIDGALGPNCLERPQSVAEWRSSLGLGTGIAEYD